MKNCFSSKVALYCLLLVVFLIPITAMLLKNDYKKSITQEKLVQDQNNKRVQIIKESTQKYEIDFKYPITNFEVLDKQIQKFVTEQINSFKLETENVDTKNLIKFGLYADYSIVENSFEIINVDFMVSIYTGGAHPNSYQQTFVYDNQKNKVVTLQDLFDVDYLGKIAELSFENLKNKFNKTEIDLDWLRNGTDPLPENYQNFVIEKDSVKFIFPPYQVAPYAFGTVEVVISFYDVKDLFTEEYKTRFGLNNLE